LGDPTLISRIEHYFETGKKIPAPSPVEKFKIMKKHLEEEILLRGERVGIKFFRKLYPFYISGVKNAAKLRSVLITEENYSKLREYFDYIEKELNCP